MTLSPPANDLLPSTAPAREVPSTTVKPSLKLGALWLTGRVRRMPALAWVERLIPGFVRRRLALKRRGWLSALVSFPALPSVEPQRLRVECDVVSNGVSERQVGANVFAFMRGQFGLGESARLYVEALLGSGIPLTLHDVAMQIPHGQNDRQFDGRLGGEAHFPVDVVFVNPDHFEQALDNVATLRGRPARRYIVAVWFWELENIPPAWISAIACVDEILVASEFVARAFRDATAKPVTRVPLPLGAISDSGATRADFGIESGKFLFLTSFDFNSSVYRKNPFDVIAAFQRAFPPGREDVRLLIKSSNGQHYDERLLELLNRVEDDPRIVVRDGVLPREHLRALQRCCDAYISLHRAEGFGLGMAESMAMGKPVIATGWSGNLEFMTPHNSWLVDYELVPVPPSAYPFWEGQRWAQPCIEHASRCMQQVVDNAELRTSRSARGLADVSARLSQEAAATIIEGRLAAITASLARADTEAGGASPSGDGPASSALEH